MDVAFSDTNDRLVSSGEVLNVRMQNPWQYSSFSSNRCGQLDASSSFNSSFQSKAHLLKDPANTADRTAFPFNANWLWRSGANPVATTRRVKGFASTDLSVSAINLGSIVHIPCTESSEGAWTSWCEAANWSNTSASRSILIVLSLRGQTLGKESG